MGFASYNMHLRRFGERNINSRRQTADVLLQHGHPRETRRASQAKMRPRVRPWGVVHSGGWNRLPMKLQALRWRTTMEMFVTH